MNTKELSPICRQVRRDIITMTANAGSGHPGGSLSAVELMTSVFFNHMRVDPKNPHDPDRDRFVLSKGHAAPATTRSSPPRLYLPRRVCELPPAALHPAGPPRRQEGPRRGRLHGLSRSGRVHRRRMALGAKHLGKDTKVFALVGDGESQEGQIWELIWPPRTISSTI